MKNLLEINKIVACNKFEFTNKIKKKLVKNCICFNGWKNSHRGISVSKQERQCFKHLHGSMAERVKTIAHIYEGDDTILQLRHSTAGSQPLKNWKIQMKNGHVKRLIDDDLKTIVLEIYGVNVATGYITCPADPKASLAITLPFIVFLVKNMRKFFTFEITVLDDQNINRRFRCSNYQSCTRVQTFCSTMPLGLTPGWNTIQFNLAEFLRRAYGTLYVETVRVQVHANVRIRRIFFCDRLYEQNDIPSEYKIMTIKDAAKERTARLRESRSFTQPPPSSLTTLHSPPKNTV